MKPGQYLVKVGKIGKQRSQLWESNEPMGIGSPIRWVLEKTSTGVFIRDVTGKNHEISDSVIHVDKDSLEHGRMVEVPSGAGKSPIKLSIHKLRPIPPAFASAAETGPSANLSQLFAFAGVLRT